MSARIFSSFDEKCFGSGGSSAMSGSLSPQRLAYGPSRDRSGIARGDADPRELTHQGNGRGVKCEAESPLICTLARAIECGGQKKQGFVALITRLRVSDDRERSTDAAR